MPFACALRSFVRECSLSVHVYRWSIVGPTGGHTTFGTWGSQVQILPLRPSSQHKNRLRGQKWGTKRSATVRQACTLTAGSRSNPIGGHCARRLRINHQITNLGVRSSNLSGAPINPGTSCIQRTATTTGQGNATGNSQQMHWDLTTGFIAPCLPTRTARQARCFPDNVRKHGDRVRLYIR